MRSSSSWNRSIGLLLVVVFMYTSLAHSSPSWSTYHGQEIKRLQVSDTGITLGLTGQGAVFLLARDSRFIASWSRDVAYTLEALSLSRDGKYAAICYDDGYTALFTQDGQEGRSLWAYSISQVRPSSLALHPSGSYLGIATSPSFQEGEGTFYRASTLYLFDGEGKDLWRRTLDSQIVSLDINEERWMVVGGNSYETPLGVRGRQAIYLYDARGDLVWDLELDEGVEKVGFTSEGILVLTSEDRFSHYDLSGNKDWEIVEQVHIATFSREGYTAGFYENKVFLLTPAGERAWVFGFDGLVDISLSGTGSVAILTDRDVTVWNAEGVETFYYSPGEQIYSLSLSDNGRYLLLGMNKVSQFILQ